MFKLLINNAKRSQTNSFAAERETPATRNETSHSNNYTSLLRTINSILLMFLIKKMNPAIRTKEAVFLLRRQRKAFILSRWRGSRKLERHKFQLTDDATFFVVPLSPGQTASQVFASFAIPTCAHRLTMAGQMESQVTQVGRKSRKFHLSAALRVRAHTSERDTKAPSTLIRINLKTQLFFLTGLVFRPH